MILKLSLSRMAVLAVVAGSLSLTSCEYIKEYLPKDPDGGTPPVLVDLKNHSVTPALIKKLPGFQSVQVYSLLSSDDSLTQSPDFVYGGSADGAGLLRAEDGKGFIYVTNHEDNFAVSRITLDETFKPVKGEYILNSDGGQWRLCSATLATPEEHGFGPLFITCGESGPESRTHALNPFAPVNSNDMSREKAALGRWSAENAVPLPKEAYNGKTVIVIGDDDSGMGGGQLALYISNQGDLDNGDLYALRRTNKNPVELKMSLGTNYAVEFVKIDNQEDLLGEEINALGDSLSLMKFGRVEDIDYRKGGGANSREIYFNVTGQANSGVNAGEYPNYPRSKYGRTYRLTLDPNNPLKGTLNVVLDGDDRDSKAGLFQNPDNICVTNNYAYIQEDPNGYLDETHDSYIYQYNLTTGELKPAFELDHRRDAEDAAKYNVDGPGRLGSWEYGAMIDVSDLIGVPNSFMVNIQPHTWRAEEYVNPDGGSLRPEENQSSQTIIIKGLPK